MDNTNKSFDDTTKHNIQEKKTPRERLESLRREHRLPRESSSSSKPESQATLASSETRDQQKHDEKVLQLEKQYRELHEKGTLAIKAYERVKERLIENDMIIQRPDGITNLEYIQKSIDDTEALITPLRNILTTKDVTINLMPDKDIDNKIRDNRGELDKYHQIVNETLPELETWLDGAIIRKSAREDTKQHNYADPLRNLPF